VLSTWGISAAALLIAAGIILFLVALQSIRGQYGSLDDETLPRYSEARIVRVAFRLAFPYIVSPYGIAIVILVLTIRPDAVPLTSILVMLGAIMLLNAMVMLIAHRIARSIYLLPGLVVIAAVLSVLQVALGVQLVITGVMLADWG